MAEGRLGSREFVNETLTSLKNPMEGVQLKK